MRRILCTTVLAALAVPAVAQLPQGWAIGSMDQLIGTATSGGLVAFNPYEPSTRFDITGVPPGMDSAGAGDVLVRESDGTIIVSDADPSSGSMSIHQLTLTGAAVTNTVTFNIGTATGTARIEQMQWLDPNTVMFFFQGVTNAAFLNTVGVGLLDITTGAITEVPIPIALSAQSTALAYDSVNQNIYLGQWGLGSAPISSRIMRLPLTGGFPAIRAIFVGSVTELEMDTDGTVLVSLLNATSGTDFKRLDDSGFSGVLSSISTNLLDTGAVTPDEVDGGYLVFGALNGLFGWYNLRPGLPERLVFSVTGSGPQSGFGSGIYRPIVMETYGTTSSPTINTRTWDINPNPGGAPYIGNSSFALSNTGTPSNDIGALVLCEGDVNGLPSQFGTLWVDPSRIITTFTVLPAPNPQSVTIPIPNDPNLVGFEVFCQWVHRDQPGPGNLVTTDALKFTIMDN